MDVNTENVKAYAFERLLCTCISRGFFIGLSLDFAFACKTACDEIHTSSGPVGLSKWPLHEFHSAIPIQLTNKSLHVLIVPNKKCNNETYLITLCC